MFDAAEIGSEIDKKTYRRELSELRVALVNAQYDLRKADFATLILVAGDDRSAQNDLVHTLHEWMDARYLPVLVFDAPTDEERERPRFWRYWRQLPGRSEARIFLGAWAVAAVADRARGELDELGFERRLEHVERFEEALAENGVLLLKFWLHLPRAAHKKRAAKAKKGNGDRNPVEADWLFSTELDEALPLAERMLRRTSGARTPWQVVESSHRRWCNLTIGRTILSALTSRLTAPAAPAPPPPAAMPPAAPVLDTVDLDASLERAEYRKRLETLQKRLGRLAQKARREGLSSVLVFEGWDAAGKGGVIRRITGAMDAHDYRVVPISAPTQEEKDHHYLWRFWRHMPRSGHMLIFDRSWYGRVLVERVEGYALEHEWRRAYTEIVDLERQIVEHGWPLLKFWLHLDEDEQLRRFEAREKTPYKKYKIGREDYRNREKRPEYVEAVNEMVARTSWEGAPWHLVAANDKRWARVRVLDTICDALENAKRRRARK